MRRREFITLLGGAAAAWPFTGRAHQPERVRRIGVLMNRTVDDAHGQARLLALRQALQQLGWSDGRNVQIDIRWGEDDVDRERKAAVELVALAPDIIVASGTLSVAALQNISRTLPIVFAAVADPVGAGFVDSLARPVGNATGFMIYEYSLSAKWLELLKQIAPGVTRAASFAIPPIPWGSLRSAPSRARHRRSASR
jgi:putative ABC transport system substrate-binding protein